MRRQEIYAAKCLTLWQPMAGAVGFCGKDLENRPRRPPASVIGKVLLIHAGKKFYQPHFDWMVGQGLALESDINCLDFHVHGAIVAVCRVKEVVEHSPSKWWMGPIGLELDEITRLWAPIECKGMQGYWKAPEHVLAAVADQVTR